MEIFLFATVDNLHFKRKTYFRRDDIDNLHFKRYISKRVSLNKDCDGGLLCVRNRDDRDGSSCK